MCLMRFGCQLITLIIIQVAQAQHCAYSQTFSAVVPAEAKQKKFDDIAQERVETPEPNAVSLNGKRYQAVHWGKARGLQQNGGYIAVIDERSGREIALIKIYSIEYDADLEEDVQDIFIKKLSLDTTKPTLWVENERGNVYALDLLDFSVKPAVNLGRQQ